MAFEELVQNACARLEAGHWYYGSQRKYEFLMPNQYTSLLFYLVYLIGYVYVQNTCNHASKHSQSEFQNFLMKLYTETLVYIILFYK